MGKIKNINYCNLITENDLRETQEMAFRRPVCTLTFLAMRTPSKSPNTALPHSGRRCEYMLSSLYHPYSPTVIERSQTNT